MTARQQRHKQLVAAAIADGRLSERSRTAWMMELARNGVKAERKLASLASPKAAQQAARSEDRPWFPESASTRRGAAA